MYQPIPFEGYEGVGHVRNDCAERFGTIRLRLPEDISGMSFFDYGCAEGYFLFRFLQGGAKRAVFIDQDNGCLEYSEKVANEHGLEDYCEFRKTLPEGRCDVGIYLDVHYNGKTPTLKEMKGSCRELFISPSGEGNTNSPMLHKELNEVFDYVDPIYTGYENRTIFYCK